MESYLIKYKNNILGVYTDINQAKLFIHSCLSNNLMNESAEILVFTTNSCYCTNKMNIILDNKSVSLKPIIKPVTLITGNNKLVPKIFIPIPEKEIDCKDPAFLKLAEDKITLQHKINLLKLQRERIKESKELYDHDIKLYNKFKQNLSSDNSFIIPDLFKDKFNILNKLDDENKLNWDNFFKEYNHNNIYGDYFKLNSYDKSFIVLDKKKNNIDEEFEIESDAETSISDSE
jgi:hypothetical protein